MTVLNTEARIEPVLNTTDRVPRVFVAVRLAPAALARIDAIASLRGVTRSAMLRDLLRLGLDAWDRGKR